MSSAALVFDRLAYVDRLKSGGIAEEQARAHAAALEIALGDTVATKTDVRDLGRDLRSEIEVLGRDLRSEIEVLGRDLRSEIEVLGRDLRSEVQEVRSDLRNAETRLEAKIETAMASVKVDILRWLLVTQVALGGFLFAALRFIH